MPWESDDWGSDSTASAAVPARLPKNPSHLSAHAQKEVPRNRVDVARARLACPA